MANKIILKKSSVVGKVPASGDLEVGEIAVNLADQKLYSKNASGTVIQLGGGSGSGDVVGPASATDNALARFDGTTGKLIQNSLATLDDSGNMDTVTSKADAFDIDTTATPAAAVGRLSWDDGNGTAQLGMKGGNVTLQLGEELLARVYNDSGVALTDGQIVYISGAQGNRIAVKLAKADSETTSAGTLGMVTEPIAIGAEGFITVVGTVNKLDTTGLIAGALVYLSATTAGAYTTTPPTAPNHRVTLGYVERVHNIVGSIYVKVDNGYELDELHNVLITSPTSGNTLIYDASAGVWKNANLTDGTGITITEGAGSITIANSGVISLTGTTNEIDVSASAGSVTLSLPATINADTTGNAATATSAGKWTTARTLSFTGDATGSGSVDGSANVATALTLANTAVTAGSYTNTALTVDAKGRITAASSGTAPVTSVGATAPIQSSGGVTPTISITQASSTTNGYLSSTDWNTFNNKTSNAGTVTSVALSLPAQFSVSGSPVTTSGTLTASWASQTANYVFAAPNGTAGTPTFRSLVAADIPTLNQNTTGSAGSVANAITFNNGGSGDASGTTYNGSAARTVSYNSVGAPSTTGTNASGTWGISISGNAATATSATSATSATTATNQSGGTVNATTISSSQGITDSYSGVRVVNPGGAALTGQTASQTGAIKIKLPTATLNSSTMMRMTVKIYEYNGGLSRTIELGGYNYTGGSWYNIFATQSTQNGGDLNVRFGQDSTSDCVWIGETTSTWAYPQVFVTEFQGGYSNATQALWSNGWAVSFVTAFDTVEVSTVAYLPVTSGNVATYASSFPAGTIMLFRQTAAPTGWTKDTTNYNDSALRVVTGTVGSGGTAGFTTAFASQTPAGTVGSTTATGSVSISGGSVSATTLATTQIPSHTHSCGQPETFPYAQYGNGNYGASAGTSGAAGGGGSHTHGFTAPTGSFTGTAHNHTFTGTAINLAVKYCDVIFATKN